MPGYDKTGPIGSGPMTGRKSGRCTGNIVDDAARPFGRGGRGRMGRGNSNGFGRGRSNGSNMLDYGGNSMLNKIEQLINKVNSLEDELKKYKETR